MQSTKKNLRCFYGSFETYIRSSAVADKEQKKIINIFNGNFFGNGSTLHEEKVAPTVDFARE